MIFGLNRRSYNNPFIYKLFSNTYWRKKKSHYLERKISEVILKKKKKKARNAQCHSVKRSQTKDGLTAW